MKNLKLALMGTALTSVLATSAIADECTFSGFYTGAQLGGGATHNEMKFNQPELAETAVLEHQSSHGRKSKLSGSGIIGGLHAGYGKQFPNRFYLGLEAYGNLSNNKVKDDAIAYISRSFKAERNNAFGLALRPGVVLGNSLFYVKLGVESANFKYSYSTSGNALGGHGVERSGSKNTRRIGFVPGIGAAFNVTEHIILGLEATHTFYNAATINNVGYRGVRDDRIMDPNLKPGNSKNKTKFHSQATDVFARISYKW